MYVHEAPHEPSDEQADLVVPAVRVEADGTRSDDDLGEARRLEGGLRRVAAAPKDFALNPDPQNAVRGKMAQVPAMVNRALLHSRS
jgi:hypothetical protein